MRIALIGPSYPFRGGISLNTTLLYRALKLKNDLLFISFKRQYPKILFPGESDREPDFTFIQEKDAKPLLDSMNPFSWFATAFKCSRFKPDVTIIPWWVVFWFPHFITIIYIMRLFSKTKIMIICHNLFEHEKNSIKKALSLAILRKADYIVVHSSEEKKKIESLNMKAKVSRLWLPVFEYEPWHITKEVARKELGFEREKKLLLYFGIIRPYKGLNHLLKAIATVKGRFDLTLMIVGEFWTGKEEFEKEVDTLGIKQNIHVVDHFIPSDKIGVYMAAADAVVFPYISATGSGALQIAISCGKSVITTNVGCFPDIVKNGINGLIVEAGDSQDLADKIIKFYKDDMEKVFANKITDLSQELSLEAIGNAIDNIIKA
ncbi:MAG: glycosyltransferase [Candidatus Schekmanbacteria bacterium]|nr:glycosyltransferase [Candidatus Schekmanbacteria bacterium]